MNGTRNTSEVSSLIRKNGKLLFVLREKNSELGRE